MERRRALEEPAKDGPAKVILGHSGVLARLMCYDTGLGQDMEAVRKGFGLCGDGVTVAGMPTVVPTLRSHVVFDSVCMHSGRYVFAEVQQSPGAKGYLAKREEFYRAVAIVNQQGRDFSGDDSAPWPSPCSSGSSCPPGRPTAARSDAPPSDRP